MRTLLVVLIVGSPLVARAGGLEIIEQSPQGVAMVGAQTAIADDASAVFYNPAGMAYQPGFGGLAGGFLVHSDTNVETGGTTVAPEPDHTAVAPTLYATQRLGRHFAAGLGAFANFGEHFKYPNDWTGRYLGTFIDVMTTTINFAVAYRPLKWLSFGGGFDVMPASLDVYQGVNFGGGDGTAHAGLTGVGVGGNAGMMVDLYQDYLRFGFSYRSRIDVHFDGASSINAPPEVQNQVAGLLSASSTLPFPHNFSFALSSRPIDQLIFDVDVHYTLWSDLSTLTLNQTSPMTGASFPNTVALDLHNSWGVRVGGEARALAGRLRFRLGGGWDQTPVPRSTLGPLLPDTDRVLIAGGFGYHARWWSIDASYMAAILLESTSQNPDLQASYSTVGHVVSLGATIRFAGLGGHLAANNVAWSGDERNRHYASR